MKLYSSALSPYGARARLIIALKQAGDQVEILPPPGGSGSAAYKEINPIGKIPCLLVGDTLLTESLAIGEYLDAVLPGESLLPGDPLETAKVRMLCQLFDHYSITALLPLFSQIAASEPDKAVIAATMENLNSTLAMFQRYMGDGQYLVGDSLTLADCAVAPFALLLEKLPAVFDQQIDAQGLQKFIAWWNHIKVNPTFAGIFTEIETALHGYLVHAGKA